MKNDERAEWRRKVAREKKMMNQKKGALIVAGIIFGLMAIMAFAACMHAQAAPQKETAAPSVEAPVKADAEFLDVLADYGILQRMIAHFVKQSGATEIPVSIAELSNRLDAKTVKLKSWMKAHGVGENWNYDSVAQQWTPPAKPVASPEPSGVKK